MPGKMTLSTACYKNFFTVKHKFYCSFKLPCSHCYKWFKDNCGLTRANGDRLRAMVLSRGNTEELGKMYKAWLGKDPSIEPMLKERGLMPEDGAAK